jgi:hypothetical protein
VFCIYAEPEAMLLSGYHNRSLLDAYVQIETKINHQFIYGEPLIAIQAKLDQGWVPTGQKVSWKKECGGF